MYMLCQSCGIVFCYKPIAHAGIDLCICGGEFCACPLCSDTARKVMRAHRAVDEANKSNLRSILRIEYIRS